MLNIFKNESYLIEDTIKESFYKKYKNVEIVITCNEFNELLQGIDLKIIDKFTNTSRTAYISCYDYNTITEFYNNIMDKIDNVIRSTIRKNYFK